MYCVEVLMCSNLALHIADKVVFYPRQISIKRGFIKCIDEERNTSNELSAKYKLNCKVKLI